MLRCFIQKDAFIIKDKIKCLLPAYNPMPFVTIELNGSRKLAVRGNLTASVVAYGYGFAERNLSSISFSFCFSASDDRKADCYVSQKLMKQLS